MTYCLPDICVVQYAFLYSLLCAVVVNFIRLGSDLLFRLQTMCSSCGASGSSCCASKDQLHFRSVPLLESAISCHPCWFSRTDITDAEEAKRKTSFPGESADTALSNGIAKGLAQDCCTHGFSILTIP